MADIRIKDLTTTASSTASDDFIAVDGTTNGTRKLSAFSPTFGGNATVTGTLTVNGVATASAGISIGDGTFGAGKIYTSATGGLSLGAKTGSSYDFILATPSGSNLIAYVPTGTDRLVVPSTTSSTTTSSGALVVGNGTSGGLGVGGNITLGGGVNIAGAASDPLPAGTSGIWTLSGSGLRINSAGVTFASLTGTTLGTATVTVNGTTASTSTSSGALVVGGGVGVGGAGFFGGNIQCNAVFASNNTTLYLRPQGATVSSGEAQLTTAGNLTLAGTLTASGTGDSSFAGILRVNNGAIVASGASAPASGSGVELQHAGTIGRILAYNRTASSPHELTINHAGGNVTIGGTGTVTSILGTTPSTSTSSGALVVSGGVGVAGAINCGGDITAPTTANITGGRFTSVNSNSYIEQSGSDFNYVTASTRPHVFSIGGTTRFQVTTSGIISSLPASAASLTVNSTMTFELTSNTSLKISVRGTDGTTRSVSLTLA